MKKIVFPLVLLFSNFHVGWNWDNFSLKKNLKPDFQVQPLWLVDTLADRKIKPRFINNSPPLLAGNLVIQGSAVSGIKAWTKGEGKLVWSFPVKSGVTNSITLYKGNIYFGGEMVFFTALKWKTDI